MRTINKTREFGFPNGGHSVRKLMASLEELPMDMLITDSIKQVERFGETAITVEFVETTSGTLTVQQLLNMLPKLGSRFTVDNNQLRFFFDWRDVKAHPSIYCN